MVAHAVAATVEEFTRAAGRCGARLEIIDVPGGRHGFDMLDHTDESRQAGRHALNAVLAMADLPWRDRLAILRGHVLDHIPVLALLDSFEENLRADGAGHAVRDEVLAGLLARWATDPGQSRLLITSRHPFALPDGAHRYLSFRQLGALSRAETMKLAWSLPALDRLDEAQPEKIWRLAGGHPRSLEYLDALLSAGQARYSDVTERLNAAVTARLDGADREGWLAARTDLNAALAETVALAADDVILDDLLAHLDQVPGAVDLLLGVSVYREPIDHNAVLFQTGQPDPNTEHVTDRRVAYEQITGVLGAAGSNVSEGFDLTSVSSHAQAELAPHIAEPRQLPAPEFHVPSSLSAQIAACQAASLLTASGADEGQVRLFVHRWTVTELALRVAGEPGSRLARAHRQAAAYWQWRVRVWPQDRAADVHDLLEARYHLLQAGDAEDAGEVAEQALLLLHHQGAWDQEASLIHDSLARVPADSPRRAAWIHQLGILAHDRGDYDEAARRYHGALDIFERLGDQTGTARSYQGFGMLASARGDYDEAARQYQRALDTFERLGDQANMALGYHQLGILAQNRADFDEAARQHQQALDIVWRLGDQAGMARSYHELGILAHVRGHYDEAARLYQRALDTFERLGDQAAIALCYHQLGMLAQVRGDYDEAARLYQRALDTFERLGDQAGIARGYSQLGNLEADRGGLATAVIAWHLKALAIRVKLGVPEVRNNLRRLSAYRHEIGGDSFTRSLLQATGDANLANAITSLLDQDDEADDGTA